MVYYFLCSSALKKLLTKKKYKKNAVKVGGLFKDNLVPPLDKAVYHMEYLMRHKADLKLKSTDVSGKSRSNLDVYAFLAFASLLALAFACFIARYLFVKLFVLASCLQVARKEKSA